MMNAKQALLSTDAGIVIGAILSIVRQYPEMAARLSDHLSGRNHALWEPMADLIKDHTDTDCVRSFRKNFNRLGLEATGAVQAWVEDTPEIDQLTIEVAELPPVMTAPLPMSVVVSGSNNVVVQVTPGSTVVFKS